MSPNKTTVASPLSRKAVLVSVNISQWTARKLDKRVTTETNRRYSATDDAGRFNKLLIEAKQLAEISTIVSKARALHYSMTRPWADEGPRILPNMLFEKFSNEFRVLKREMAAAADKFAAAYPSLIAERKAKLNGMFNEADYPSAKDIRAKFNLDLTILPLPDVADFRADLDADTLADIKAEMSRTSGDVVENCMKATGAQIIETVGHMAAKLKEYKTGKPGEGRKFFLDSLVENVRELAELLPAFNLTEDPRLDALTKRISKELCAEDAPVLRENDDLRADVAKSADDIVKEVEKFFS